MTPFVLAIAALLVLGRTKPRGRSGGRTRSMSEGRPPRQEGAVEGRFGSMEIERGDVVRAVAIAAIFALVFFLIPHIVGIYWVKILTAAAIYSVVALGLGLLYGRVGMVSLCQIALLALGAWVATRLLYGTGLPFPIVLLMAGLATGVIGVLVGLPALRVSGLHLALITLMFAGAITLVLGLIHFPNGGKGFLGQLSLGEFQGFGQHPPARDRGGGHRVLSLHGRRRRADVPARALAGGLEAGQGLGCDPRERARSARGGCEHHAVQALGIRARVVHDRRRRRPPRRQRRRSCRHRRSRRRTRSCSSP